eukprot:scaffold104192_cov63-Phaeocystis_antarctica.AAC.3
MSPPLPGKGMYAARVCGEQVARREGRREPRLDTTLGSSRPVAPGLCEPRLELVQVGEAGSLLVPRTRHPRLNLLHTLAAPHSRVADLLLDLPSLCVLRTEVADSLGVGDLHPLHVERAQHGLLPIVVYDGLLVHFLMEAERLFRVDTIHSAAHGAAHRPLWLRLAIMHQLLPEA